MQHMWHLVPGFYIARWFCFKHYPGGVRVDQVADAFSASGKPLSSMPEHFVWQGARVASEVAHSDREVLACVFFSYPLHPPGKQVLPEPKTNLL